MLLELRVGQVRGFDLSSLDAYRWHPGTERFDIDRWATVPFARLPASHQKLSARCAYSWGNMPRRWL